MHVGHSHSCRSFFSFRELLQIAVVLLCASFSSAFCVVTALASLARRICACWPLAVCASENASSLISLSVFSLVVTELFSGSFLPADITCAAICSTMYAGESASSLILLPVLSLVDTEFCCGSLLAANVTCQFLCISASVFFSRSDDGVVYGSVIRRVFGLAH